jgi:flagellar M-ring protein FliF
VFVVKGLEAAHADAADPDRRRTGAASPNRQLLVAGLVLGALSMILGVGYFLFVRTEYAVLYTGLRSADASAIVAELDDKGVAYKLKDGGGTILVPVEEADAVRLAIVRSDASLKGSTGFELFNKSDMGLTDFAQKINYQRAVQGELTRTIMMMDGIDNARVHLAIPERSLFRGTRSEPKAAVTLSVQRGRILDEALWSMLGQGLVGRRAERPVNAD